LEIAELAALVLPASSADSDAPAMAATPIAAEVDVRNCLRFTPVCFFMTIPSVQTLMRDVRNSASEQIAVAAAAPPSM
jgi:hypothetical protein